MPMPERDELVPLPVIIPNVVLPGAPVAEKQQQPPIPEGKEVGHGAVLPWLSEEPVLDERVQVLPMFQVLRTEQVIGVAAIHIILASGEAPGKRVVGVVFFPDTGVENSIRGVGGR